MASSMPGDDALVGRAPDQAAGIEALLPRLGQQVFLPHAGNDGVRERIHKYLRSGLPTIAVR